MKNIFKLFGVIALAAVIGFSFTACGEEDETGTIQILVTGIPNNVMQSGQAGYNSIGLFPANGASPSAMPLAGIDVGYGIDENFGNDWYSFYMLNIHSGYKYTGTSGNYDIGFIIDGGALSGTVKVLRNARIEVNKLNTFSYNSFVDYY